MSATPWQLPAARTAGWPTSFLKMVLSPPQAAIRFAPLLFIATLAVLLFRPPDVDLYQLDRIAFGLLVIACLLRAVLLRKELWPKTSLILPMLLLSLLAMGTTLGQAFDAQTWSLLAAKFVVPYTLYYLASLTFDTPSSLRHRGG